MSEEQKKKILDFLQAENLTVVSTVGETGPESALVAFAETPQLEIIFGTSNETRKHDNLERNNKVSFVFGLRDLNRRTTVQYEGVAKKLDGAKRDEYSAELIGKNPGSQKFLYDEHQRYFLVTPTWIRYADHSKNPQEIFEVSL